VLKTEARDETLPEYLFDNDPEDAEALTRDLGTGHKKGQSKARRMFGTRDKSKKGEIDNRKSNQ